MFNKRKYKKEIKNLTKEQLFEVLMEEAELRYNAEVELMHQRHLAEEDGRKN